MQYLQKFIGLFYKDHLKKPTAIFLPLNFALPMARPIVKPIRPTKRKWGQPAISINKQAKKNWTFHLFSHVKSLWKTFVSPVFY